jgi:cysteine sulfinate desulfinase/cysteine desulfurase-like protein
MGFVIYLGHNTTTPILPEVLDAMMPYLTREWGNL